MPISLRSGELIVRDKGYAGRDFQAGADVEAAHLISGIIAVGQEDFL